MHTLTCEYKIDLRNLSNCFARTCCIRRFILIAQRACSATMQVSVELVINLLKYASPCLSDLCYHDYFGYALFGKYTYYYVPMVEQTVASVETETWRYSPWADEFHGLDTGVSSGGLSEGCTVGPLPIRPRMRPTVRAEAQPATAAIARVYTVLRLHMYLQNISVM